MVFAIRIIGVVFGLLGILLLVKPDVLGTILEFVKQGKRLYFVAILRFVLGAIFLLGARECDVTWLIFVLGILLIMKGLVVFLLGPAKLGPKLDWWKGQSNLRIRGFSLVAVAFSALIIYAA
ncbi:MAG: hypothetical protein ACXAB4_01265 [Candidatus Hodarchaeales archaeon]|jgi:hypothetical protein